MPKYHHLAEAANKRRQEYLQRMDTTKSAVANSKDKPQDNISNTQAKTTKVAMAKEAHGGRGDENTQQDSKDLPKADSSI